LELLLLRNVHHSSVSLGDNLRALLGRIFESQCTTQFKNLNSLRNKKPKNLKT